MTSKTKKIISITGVIALLLIIALPKLTFLKGEKEKAGVQAGAGNALPVDVYIVKDEDLQNKIFSTGNILANEEVELRCEMAGKIEKIYFKEGSQVKKGEVLLKINDSELQAQLLKANYSRELNEAREYRQKQMLQKEAISQEEYEIALNELNTTKAEIQLLQAQLGKTEIRAPFDGIIGLKSVSEGSYINSETRIASLQNINPIKIDFSVPEKYYNILKPGSIINFKIQGSDKNFTGHVFAIEPKVDAATRTIKIRALSSNDRLEIFPGTFAEIELTLNEIKNAMMVPSQALIPSLKGQQVLLVKDGKASPAPVEAGTRTEKSVQITSGLNRGDTVITSGLLQLRPGMPVKISVMD